MPEVTTTQNAEMKQISVPSPHSGQDIAVPSEAGGNLNFAFDPANATASRVDNNLVFAVDGGGKVTLQDFFAVGDQSLPSLTLPDGTVVAASDFFEGSGLDLSTAAGPGAGAPASGGTSYDDDGGSLLAGLDRYTMLGEAQAAQNDAISQGLGALEPGSPGAVFVPGGITPAIPGAVTPVDTGTTPTIPDSGTSDPGDTPTIPDSGTSDPGGTKVPVTAVSEAVRADFIPGVGGFFSVAAREALGGYVGKISNTDGWLSLGTTGKYDASGPICTLIFGKSAQWGELNALITPHLGNNVSQDSASAFALGTYDIAQRNPDGPEISFDWKFSATDNDGAVWVLKGADGSMYSGKICQGNMPSGTCGIDFDALGIPAGSYELFIIAADQHWPQAGLSTLSISEIDYYAPDAGSEPGYRITDASVLENEADVNQGAVLLASVTVNGETLDFLTQDPVTFKGGDAGHEFTLTIGSDGTYTYSGATGELNVDYSVVSEKDGGNTDTATLYIRPSELTGSGDIQGTDGLSQIIRGGGENDTIHAGGGNDVIFAGDGNDLIFAGVGDDILFGGKGADTFGWVKNATGSDFDSGTDKIMDFTQGEDIIRLNLDNLLSSDRDSLGDLLAKISWAANQGENTLTLTVDADGVRQNIEVHFDGGVDVNNQSYDSFADFYSQNRTDSGAMEALILTMLG